MYLPQAQACGFLFALKMDLKSKKCKSNKRISNP
nr:MAG TPA: hypothetical protein [Caudoviricetes sp.]DAY44436.1 MAG TPA: hypothetical protein [Caudoviricetes sp.]